MAWPKSIPPPCDSEIYEKGEGVCIVEGKAEAVERWMRRIALVANAKLDWHYSGGRASVLHLGDEASRKRVLDAIREMKGELEGHIVSIDGPARYRA